MENKLTPEEQSISKKLSIDLAKQEFPNGYGDIDEPGMRETEKRIAYEKGFQKSFNLLWPYVGEAWRAGKLYGIREMKEYHGGPENNQPCEPDYLKKLLTALKSLPDAK